MFNYFKRNIKIIFLSILCISIGIIIGFFINYNNKTEIKKDNNITNDITDNKLTTAIDINYNGNFGNIIGNNTELLNIGEYMTEANELISSNKKYKVILKYGTLCLILNSDKQQQIRTIDQNVRFNMIPKQNYNYTIGDKNIINNGLLLCEKEKRSDNTYVIKIKILNKLGRYFEGAYLANEKSTGYIKLDNCGNLILYIDNKEKLDIFNLFEF